MIGSILGGVIGSGADDSDEFKAQQARDAALAQLSGIYVPTIEEQRINLQNLISQGELTPEMIEVISQDPSLMEEITTDPRLKEAQMKALFSLQDQGQTGLTATDRQALISLNKGVERDASARNASILQNMAQRGMSGSGAELAAQLAASQQGTELAQDQSNNIAALATQRALEATAQAGNLAGNQQSNEFNQKSAQAQAQDAINRFNAQNRQNVLAQNTGTTNQAQQYNLGEKQRISDSNVNNANQQEVHNKGLYQTQFGNQLSKATGISGQQNLNSKDFEQKAKDTRAMWTGIGQGVDEAALAAVGYASGKPKAPATKAHGGMVKESDHPLFGMLGKETLAPEVQGDSEENDKIPHMLSPGEIVIPRSIANASDEVITDFIKSVKKHSKG